MKIIWHLSLLSLHLPIKFLFPLRVFCCCFKAIFLGHLPKAYRYSSNKSKIPNSDVLCCNSLKNLFFPRKITVKVPTPQLQVSWTSLLSDMCANTRWPIDQYTMYKIIIEVWWGLSESNFEAIFDKLPWTFCPFLLHCNRRNRMGRVIWLGSCKKTWST